MKYEVEYTDNIPSMAEYIDAVVKDDVEAQERYIAKCLDIKARYSKEI